MGLLLQKPQRVLSFINLIIIAGSHSFLILLRYFRYCCFQTAAIEGISNMSVVSSSLYSPKYLLV